MVESEGTLKVIQPSTEPTWGNSTASASVRKTAMMRSPPLPRDNPSHGQTVYTPRTFFLTFRQNLVSCNSNPFLPVLPLQSRPKPCLLLLPHCDSRGTPILPPPQPCLHWSRIWTRLGVWTTTPTMPPNSRVFLEGKMKPRRLEKISVSSLKRTPCMHRNLTALLASVFPLHRLPPSL